MVCSVWDAKLRKLRVVRSEKKLEMGSCDMCGRFRVFQKAKTVGRAVCTEPGRGS